MLNLFVKMNMYIVLLFSRMRWGKTVNRKVDRCSLITFAALNKTRIIKIEQ